MKSKVVVAGILFGDLEGFSRIKDDLLKEKITEKLQEIESLFLTAENHFFFNTWGDGVMICSYDPLDLADAALRIRDYVRNTNWKRLGFKEEIGIRIGLHIQRITLKINNQEKISNVVGKGVDVAARIEPIVEINKVFCSKRFYEHLTDEENLPLKWRYLGSRELAKDYGEMDLYELLWTHEYRGEEDYDLPEAETMMKTEIPLPRMANTGEAKEFSAEEKNAYVTEGFEKTKEYFLEALRLLKAKYPKLKIVFRKITAKKFICEIYIKQRLRSECKVWLREKPSPFTGYYNIAYSDNFSNPADDEKYKIWLTVHDDGEELYFNLSRMGKFMNRENFIAENQQPSDAAEQLWIDFISSLEDTDQ